MKKKVLAFSMSAVMLAGLPLNGLTAFAEPVPPDAPVPDWVPTDFMSAMDFSNEYGATHVADGKVCIVLRQENDDRYTYSEDVAVTGDWDDDPCALYRDVVYDAIQKPEAPDEGSKEYEEYRALLRELEYLPYDEQTDSYSPPFRFRVLVYDMLPESTLKFTQKYIYKDVERKGFTYEFSNDREGGITETDLCSWMPDCIAEYSAYKSTHNPISLYENYIVYCDDVNFSLGLCLDIEQCGTARIVPVCRQNIVSNRLMMLAGEPDYPLYVYRVLNNGLVKVTAATYFAHGETPEDQHRQEFVEYFGAASPDGVRIIDPGQFTEPVYGDCNGDGEFSVADAVMLNKYLLGSGDLFYWTLADLNEDNIVNAADLSLMKQKLISAGKEQEEPKIIFKGAHDYSPYTFARNETITDKYDFYFTVPLALTPTKTKLEFQIFNADTDEEISHSEVRSTGRTGGYVMSIDAHISESEVRHYYGIVTLTDISNPKPGEPKSYKTDVFEWTIEVFHEIPAPPAA